ncbi:MAG: hypothetical protein IJT35_08890 [Paludibacteraceae bacterium]|nr:hypothetical protein [Paludibacteraceae bacterium]
MKKVYNSPLTEAVLFLRQPVMMYMSDGGLAPNGAGGEAPGRREFTPQFDHGNLI